MVNATTSQPQSGSVADTSSVSTTPAFKDFAFQSIGKVPSLFKRLSSPDPTATYNPDEEPQVDEQQMDQSSAQDPPIPPLIRTRPSLTELLAKEQANNITSTSSGDQVAPKTQTMFQFFQQQPLGQAQIKTPIPIPTPSKPVPQGPASSSTPSSIAPSASTLNNAQHSTSQAAPPMSSDFDIQMSDPAPSIPSHISSSSIVSSSPAKSSPLAQSQSTALSISASTSTPVHAPPASALRAIHQSLSAALAQLNPIHVQAPIEHLKSTLASARTHSSEALVLAQSSVTDAEAALKLARKSFNTANASLAKAREADVVMATLVDAVESVVGALPDEEIHNKTVGEMRKVEVKMGKWTSAHENAVEVTRRRKREAEMLRLQQQQRDGPSAPKDGGEAVRAPVRSQSDPGFNHPVDVPMQMQTQDTIQSVAVSDEAEAARLVLSQRQMEYLERKRKAEEELRKKKDEEDEAERVMREEEERKREEEERRKKLQEEQEEKRRLILENKQRATEEAAERIRRQRQRQDAEKATSTSTSGAPATPSAPVVTLGAPVVTPTATKETSSATKPKARDSDGDHHAPPTPPAKKMKMSPPQTKKKSMSPGCAAPNGSGVLPQGAGPNATVLSQAPSDAPGSMQNTVAGLSTSIVSSIGSTLPLIGSHVIGTREGGVETSTSNIDTLKQVQQLSQEMNQWKTAPPGIVTSASETGTVLGGSSLGFASNSTSGSGTSGLGLGSTSTATPTSANTIHTATSEPNLRSIKVELVDHAPFMQRLGVGVGAGAKAQYQHPDPLPLQHQQHQPQHQHTSSSAPTTSTRRNASGRVSPATSVLLNVREAQLGLSATVGGTAGSPTSGLGSTTTTMTTTATTAANGPKTQGKKKKGGSKDFSASSNGNTNGIGQTNSPPGSGQNSPQGGSSNKTLPGPALSTSINLSIPIPTLGVVPTQPRANTNKKPQPKITIATPPMYPPPSIPPSPFAQVAPPAVPVSFSAVSVGSTNSPASPRQPPASPRAMRECSSLASSNPSRLGGGAPATRQGAYLSSGHANANANVVTSPNSSLSDILEREVQSDVLPSISNDNGNGRGNGASRAASGNFDIRPSSSGARYPPNIDHYSPSPPPLSANRDSTSSGSSYVPNSGSGAIQPSTSNESNRSGTGNTRRTRARDQPPPRRSDHYSPPGSSYQPLSRSRSRSRSRSPQLRYPVSGYQTSLPPRRASPEPVGRRPVYDRAWAPRPPRSPSPSPAPPPARPWLPPSDRDSDRSYEYSRPGSPRLGDKRRVSYQYDNADDGYPSERGRRGRFESSTPPLPLPTMVNGDSYRPGQQQPQHQRARYPSWSRSPVRRSEPVRAHANLGATTNGHASSASGNGNSSVPLAQRFNIPPAQGMIHDPSSSSISGGGGVTPSSSAGNLNMQDTGGVRSPVAGVKPSVDLLNRITDPGRPAVHANDDGHGHKNYHQNQHHPNQYQNHHSNQQRNHNNPPYARRQTSATSSGVALEQRISKPSLAERVR
ncbi:hypothetical protein BJ165DRAFT_984889 [Panaeolus papilionaceus]|nr:hypothetical protein BJ165DRAFT_984889 [Panaeolus papilionaceus]